MWMNEAKPPRATLLLLYISAFAIPSQHDPGNSHERKIGEQKSCATSTIPTCPGAFRVFASNDIKMMRHVRLMR
jgi:hypothetical protein